MSGIRIDIDPAQLAAVQTRLAHIKNGAARALSRALNKTATKARTVASTEIRKQVNLKARDVAQELYVDKAALNALNARLRAKARGLLMYHYVTNLGTARKGRPRTKIRVQAKPGNTVVMSSAFYIQTATSGKLTPAVRTGITHIPNRWAKYGKSIKVLHGPSVSQVFATVKDFIGPGMNTVLVSNFQHETDWLYSQHPPPSGDGSEE